MYSQMIFSANSLPTQYTTALYSIFFHTGYNVCWDWDKILKQDPRGEIPPLSILSKPALALMTIYTTLAKYKMWMQLDADSDAATGLQKHI